MIEIDTGTEELFCMIEDRVASITLNKPHKKNALGDVLTPALRQTLAQLENDERAGAVMSTGAGDAFAAGFLYGMTHEFSPLESGRIGSVLAGAVIEQTGPRYQGNAHTLICEQNTSRCFTRRGGRCRPLYCACL